MPVCCADTDAEHELRADHRHVEGLDAQIGKDAQRSRAQFVFPAAAEAEHERAVGRTLGKRGIAAHAAVVERIDHPVDVEQRNLAVGDRDGERRTGADLAEFGNRDQLGHRDSLF